MVHRCGARQLSPFHNAARSVLRYVDDNLAHHSPADADVPF